MDFSQCVTKERRRCFVDAASIRLQVTGFGQNFWVVFTHTFVSGIHCLYCVIKNRRHSTDNDSLLGETDSEGRRTGPTFQQQHGTKVWSSCSQWAAVSPVRALETKFIVDSGRYTGTKSMRLSLQTGTTFWHQPIFFPTLRIHFWILEWHRSNTLKLRVFQLFILIGIYSLLLVVKPKA